MGNKKNADPKNPEDKIYSEAELAQRVQEAVAAEKARHDRELDAQKEQAQAQLTAVQEKYDQERAERMAHAEPAGKKYTLKRDNVVKVVDSAEAASALRAKGFQESPS